MKLLTVTFYITCFIFFVVTTYAQNVDDKQRHVLPSHPQVQASLADTLTFSRSSSRMIMPANPAEKQIVLIKDSQGSNPFKDLLPILTLFLGIVINQLIIWIQDKRKIRKSGERWIAELRGLNDPIQQQIDALKAITEQDSEDVYEPPELTVGSTLSCEIFKSLDKSDLLKYIESKGVGFFQCKTKATADNAVKTSNQVHGMINILTHLHESLKDKFNEFLNGWSEHSATVNQNLQLLSQAFAWYGVDLEQELNGDPVDDPRYRPILDLFTTHIEDHREDGNFNLFELQANFFWPLIQILGRLRHDERVREMNKQSSECFNAVKGIRMEKRYWLKNVETISARYSENLGFLHEIINTIERRGNS